MRIIICITSSSLDDLAKLLGASSPNNCFAHSNITITFRNHDQIS